jgi:DNA polymerase-3 subunit gamma/tau
MLTNCKPALVSDTLCRITVANPWQKQEFAKFGKQLMDLVRDKLQNDLIKLQVDIAEYDRSQKAYTTADKYKLLAEMNPHLVDLKNQLNLQLE